MNSRSSSSAQPLHRPSLSNRSHSRRLSVLSTAEAGRDGASAQTTGTELTEEIEEIKRYEDFTTIDWVQDSAREQLRRRARSQENAGFFERDGKLGWRRKLRESYDAGQAWIVVTLVGAAIGLNAGFLNIVTEWLSDTKRGYCTTAFYLNQDFCCWGDDRGMNDSLLLFSTTHSRRLSRMAYLDFHMACELHCLLLVLGMLLDQKPKRWIADKSADSLRSGFREPRKIIRTLCRRLRYFRDQVHHRRFCDEGISGIPDIVHKIHLFTSCDCFWSLSRQRRPKCSLCGLHRKRNFKILR